MAAKHTHVIVKQIYMTMKQAHMTMKQAHMTMKQTHMTMKQRDSSMKQAHMTINADVRNTGNPPITRHAMPREALRHGKEALWT
jgi:hypothetical protein